MQESIRAARGTVLSQAYAGHPERFVRGVPTVPSLPEAVWINKPKEDLRTASDVTESTTEVTSSRSGGGEKSGRLHPISTKRVSQKKGRAEALDLGH
jgi:hypothetical protein